MKKKAAIFLVLLAILVVLMIIPAKAITVNMGGFWANGPYGKTCCCPPEGGSTCFCRLVF